METTLAVEPAREEGTLEADTLEEMEEGILVEMGKGTPGEMVGEGILAAVVTPEVGVEVVSTEKINFWAQL